MKILKAPMTKKKRKLQRVSPDGSEIISILKIERTMQESQPFIVQNMKL